MTDQHLRRQVLIPLTLTFLVLLGSFLYSGYTIRQSNISTELEHRYSGAQALFNELLSSKIEWMTATAEIIVRDEAMKNSMRRGDRDALYRQALPYFGRMSSRGGITHFYFHTQDARAFLRVSRPAQFGDSINRRTMRQAMQTGKPEYGLELGSLGTFSLRAVIPWRDESGPLGFIELGMEIESTLQAIKNITLVDYVMAIDKGFLDRQKWEAGMGMLRRQTDWDLLPDKVVIDKTLDRVPPSVAELLSRKGQLSSADTWRPASLDGRSFAARLFPLSESRGRVVGNFVLLYDITKETRDFSYFVLRIFVFGLALSAVLFIFAWRTLGRTEHKLETVRDKLLSEMANTNKVNALLEGEVEERRRVEADLVQLNENLEQRVAERTLNIEMMSRDIEKAHDELELAYLELKARQATILHQDKMAGIGLLAAGVAHEINNPIGFMASNIEELREYIPRLRRFFELQQNALETSAEPGVKRALQREREELDIDYIFTDFDLLIEESLEGAGRISSIVQNLRSFSRVDDVEYKLADIQECLESTVNITNYVLRYKAEVRREYGDIPKVHCCPQQLNQVFMNLLINAAQAIEKSGVVTIRTWADTTSVYVSVTDTGIGIPQETVSKIFEPFFTTKEVGKGTGLGLSIAYDIVSQHRGEIHVQSEPGRGTTFTIGLPLDAGAEHVR